MVQKVFTTLLQEMFCKLFFYRTLDNQQRQNSLSLEDKAVAEVVGKENDRAHIFTEFIVKCFPLTKYFVKD